MVDICPEMLSIFGIDQLGGDSHPVTGFPDTALQYVSNSKLLGYLLNLDQLALIGKR
jgi:hypothetical protein